MIYLLLSILLVAAAPAAHDDAPVVDRDIRDTVRRSYDVDPGGTLSLSLDFGNADVEVHQRDQVIVEVERVVKTDSRSAAEKVLDRMTLEIGQRGDDVSVLSENGDEKSWWGFGSKKKVEVHVRVLVPRNYHVEFDNGAGDVTIGDLDGSVTGSTGAGNVHLGAVTQQIQITTGAGNVKVNGAGGAVQIESGAGNVTLADVRGAVQVSTGAGNIKTFISRQPDRRSRLESGAGNVTAVVEPGVGVFVTASAGMGSASSDYPVETKSEFVSQSFSGRINGGGPELVMKTGVGSVALRKER